MKKLCPYLDSDGNNDFCGMSSHRLSQRHVHMICETGSYDDCPSYNNESYDSDHLRRSDRTSHSEYEEENENEHEYEYAEED